MTYKTVLDNGYVRLIDSMGSDLSIVRAARVSYNADWRSGSDTGSDEGLLRYLIENRHTSPFESVVFTFEVKCPIFIARQWQRHRTWSYNEVSARYTKVTEEFYTPESSLIGTQSERNKQQRIISENPQVSDKDAYNQELISDSCKLSFRVYQELLNNGCPRELARSVLPLATYTRFFGTVNLHNLMHWLNLRLHSHAQYEIQEYAKGILELIKPICPITMKLAYKV